MMNSRKLYMEIPPTSSLLQVASILTIKNVSALTLLNSPAVSCARVQAIL